MEITVAVCAYNAEKTLSECLQAIKEQIHKPKEVIIIDDHSKDKTASIAKDNGAKVILNEGRNLYDGRNTALKYCKTEYLAFTDSDCVPDKHWLENIFEVFQNYPDVVAGTGRHPAILRKGFSAWLHHMWFIVEGNVPTGYTGGIIGGNSYFRVEALKKIGGWMSLPYSNAEDVYIASKLQREGYKLWFDNNIIVNHHYCTDFLGLMKKTVVSGEAITVMMKKSMMKGPLWWFTIMIPFVSLLACVSFILLFFIPWPGLLGLLIAGGGSFFFFYRKFKRLSYTIPRFIARWILIWPYSVGVIRGFFKTV